MHSHWTARATLAATLGALAFAAPAGAVSVITTVAGDGTSGYGGDGGPAKAAKLSGPESVALSANGAFLIADTGYIHLAPSPGGPPPGNRVRRVSAQQTITTVAGGGSGGDGPATQAAIGPPIDVTRTSGDSFLVISKADLDGPQPFPPNYALRRVVSGVITTALQADGFGTGAQPLSIEDVAQTSDGGTLIADALGNRIVKLTVVGGQLQFAVVAGTGTAGSAGDGGLAKDAQLNSPSGVAATPDGGYLIADTFNHKIRKVAPNGLISTVAGSGQPGSSGHCGAPTAAQLREPVAVAVTGDNRFLIVDRGNHRIMEVTRSFNSGPRIVTVAGRGEAGYTGDGGPASQARLRSPEDVAVTPDGFLIADTENHVLRRVVRDPSPRKFCGKPTQPPATPNPPPAPKPEDLIGSPPETPPAPGPAELTAAVERILAGLPGAPVDGGEIEAIVWDLLPPSLVPLIPSPVPLIAGLLEDLPGGGEGQIPIPRP